MVTELIRAAGNSWRMQHPIKLVVLATIAAVDVYSLVTVGLKKIGSKFCILESIPAFEGLF